MTIRTRPSDHYHLKGDRTRSGRVVTSPVVAGWRVHYRLTCDAPGEHRVSHVLWEHEVADFAASVASIPGTIFCDAPNRPGGVEPVYGWPRTDRTERDLSREFWMGQAREASRTASAADGVSILLPLLQRAPARLHSDIVTEFQAALTEAS